MTITELPKVGKYTIDFRLGQIREVDIKKHKIRFIDIYSNKGQEIIIKFEKSNFPLS